MGINHWSRVDIINWYIFRHDILLMTILKGLLWFILKPIVEMDQVKSEKFMRPWIYLNQIFQRWTTDDKPTEFESNVPSPTNPGAFIAEFVAMEALRGVFRGVFRGVCNRLLFCWAFLRRQNMEMKNKGNLGTCAKHVVSLAIKPKYTVREWIRNISFFLEKGNNMAMIQDVMPYTMYN